VPERILSILIPAYNEERFIGALLEQIAGVPLEANGLGREVIVVDDGSHDRTAEIARSFADVRVEQQPNQGKGAAVRRALAVARGELLMIQDADLEYEPCDYLPMVAALDRLGVDAVYGNRYHAGWLAARRPGQSWRAYLGGRSLSVAAWLATGHWLADTVTALKLFRREALAELPLATRGFELDHELTARLLARGRRIAEVPIHYTPRSRTEGKKIGLRDWFVALQTFARYRKG